ncbi:unnamed protein product [Meloidogyne enterolobii]|uniref:Uncharacterized protein n=1 Tax=Meloidogyne enterolobii TaxID=390850 RepID=A0ACB0YKD9_MELEN
MRRGRGEWKGMGTWKGEGMRGERCGKGRRGDQRRRREEIWMWRGGRGGDTGGRGKGRG